MAMTDDEEFFPRLVAISQCLCAEITVRELPTPCFCGVLSGAALIADYCNPESEGNGMAYVRLLGISPLGSGNPSAPTVCAPPLEAVIEVGILRCAPMLADDGSPPDMQQQLATARLAAADMAAALSAITCCLPDSRDVSVQGWQPVGPDGGCVGGAWTAVLAGG